MSRRLAGLRHVCGSLTRYWGLSLLNVTGLAIAFAATFIIAVYVRDELTYDRFLPDAERIFLLTADYGAPGKPLVSSDKTPAGMARWLRPNSAVEAVARLHDAELPLRSDRHEALEHFYWADPNIFSVLRFKVVHGDPEAALGTYDTVVLTQAMARRYFGREDAVGKVLILDGSIRLTVTAVLADYPPNTHLEREIFVFSRAGYSMLVNLDLNPDWLWDSSYTYVRLKPGAALSPSALESLAQRNWVGGFNRPAFELVSLPDLHFRPQADNQMKPRGHLDTVMAMAFMACLILILATANVAGLMSAQIEERSGEMAVRKALGAQRHHLLFQVMAEAAVTNLVALVAALALAERLLPYINAQLGLRLVLWSSPVFLVAIAAAVAAVGTAGTLYAARRLSIVSRPYAQGGQTSKTRAYMGRMGWITIQFALLVILLVSAHTVQRQWLFAMDEALNFDADRVVMITVGDGKGQDTAFKNHILATPGVEGAAYSRFIPVYRNIRPGWFPTPSGQVVQFTRESVDTDFFRLFGVRILAGRGLSDVYAANVPPREVVINQTAALAFGYKTPPDAIGRSITYAADDKHVTSSIVGVVSDMRTATVREPIAPMVFDGQSTFFTALSVRVAKTGQAQTLAAIDRQWRRDFPRAGPIERRFFSTYLLGQYRDMLQQWRVFGLLSAVGICLNVLGLSGLSIYLARVRLREMAIRNALGARIPDIFKLRIQPFIKPLIVANLAAAIISWLLMSSWLNSFKARVDLSPVSFAGAAGLTVLITLLTVTTHVFLSSPARSSQPLRDD